MGNTHNRPNRNFTFFAISDLHCTDTSAGRRARNLVDIPRYIRLNPGLYLAVLIAGDLTDGSANTLISQKQTQNFINNWYFPLKKMLQPYNGNVRGCLGNHDAPFSSGNRKPQIVRFQKDYIGDPNFYSYDTEGVHFAIMYLNPGHFDDTMLWDGDFYPSNMMNSLIWLIGDLFVHRNMPIVLMWHYNVAGPMSAAWSVLQHNAAYDVIKHYNIQLVIVGHNHSDYSYLWGSKHIKVACVGADNPIGVCDVVNGVVTLRYWNADTNTYQSFNDRLKTDLQLGSIPEVAGERILPAQ